MIKGKINELLNIVTELKEHYKAHNKQFTLDGRLVGDIGEVLAQELYKITLYTKVEKEYDGLTEGDNRKVQIKSTMKNAIGYPRSTHPDLLLVIKIIPNKEPETVYNGETTPIKKYLAEKRKKNERYDFYIGLPTLRELNDKVDPTSRIPLR